MITLTAAVAREHQADLLRDAGRRHIAAGAAAPAVARPRAELTLRLAEAADAADVHRLEALDESAPLAGRILLALRAGTPIAALSLTDGGVAANPFEPTADAVALLRLRAGHLGAAPAPAASHRRLTGRRLRLA